MPTKFHVCQGSSCTGQGSALLLRDIEELCNGTAEVEPWGCLGRCGKGPNVEVQEGINKKVKEGIKSFRKMEDLISSNSERTSISALDRDVAKLKYSIRREEDEGKKQGAMEKAFALLGPDAKVGAMQHPFQFSSLLILQSMQILKTSPKKAVQDAEQATKLSPQWAQPYIALANALEAVGQPGEAAAELQKAMKIGEGIELRTVRRFMTRLERKAEQQKQGGGANNNQAENGESSAVTAAIEDQQQTSERPSAAVSGAAAAGTESGTSKGAAAAAAKKGKEAVGAAKSREGAQLTRKASKEFTRELGQELAKADASKELRKGSSMNVGASSKAKTGKSADEKKTKKKESASKTTAAPTSGSAAASAATWDPSMKVPDYFPWTVEQVQTLNHDCIVMRLILRDQPALCAKLCEDIGDVWHVNLKVTLPDGEEVVRPYTPASDKQDLLKGHLDLMVKVYAHGKMTQHLKGLAALSTVLVSPPATTLEPDDYDRGLIMVAGGSAVTVALQSCKAVLERHSRLQAEVSTDKGFNVHLVLCNHRARDVVFAARFHELQLKYPRHFEVVHCISAGPLPIGDSLGEATWRSGHINMASLPSRRAPGSLAIVSGPPGLCQAAFGLLRRLGLEAADIEVLDPLPPGFSNNDNHSEAGPASPSPAQSITEEHNAWQQSFVSASVDGGMSRILTSKSATGAPPPSAQPTKPPKINLESAKKSPWLPSTGGLSFFDAACMLVGLKVCRRSNGGAEPHEVSGGMGDQVGYQH